MHQRSVMTHQFAQVPRADIQRSSFDRSHGYKTTFDAGLLVPFLIDEVYPGDTFSMNATIFTRLATPIHPVMDNIFQDIHCFFCPTRLIWSNFAKFFGEQANPGDSTSFLVPQQVSPVGGYGEQTLQDWLGLPTKIAGYTHNSLPLRAYNLIWNQWYRDENLQNSVIVDLGDGPDLPANYSTLRRGKRHDYFTSCLPFPQKGPAVTLPLGSKAFISGLGFPTGEASVASGTRKDAVSGLAGVAYGNQFNSANLAIRATTLGATAVPDVYADLSTATAATINQLRQAFQIQRIYERDARGGTRYTELIQAHFGVTSPDARLQRTEYLGGGTLSIAVAPIAQTSSTATQPSPQGNLAGMGTGHGRAGFTHSFTEHGYIICLISARADLNYQQGINRLWLRNTRFDFYWPALAQIGEQTVQNQEIYMSGVPATDTAAFGYQERYAELRFKPSLITGRFRSNSAVPLDTWHLAQNFGALPVLNSNFIIDQPPIGRISAVPSEPNFIMDAFINYRCVRPMPTYGVPGNIDRF